MFFDGINKIARFDTYDSTKAGDLSYVQDLKTGVMFKIVKDEACEVTTMDHTPFLKTDHAINTVRSVQEVLHMEGDFYYIGTTFVRGVLVEGWETVKKDYVFDTYEDSPDLENMKKMAKAVITHYFSAVSNLRFESYQN